MAKKDKGIAVELTPAMEAELTNNRGEKDDDKQAGDEAEHIAEHERMARQS